MIFLSINLEPPTVCLRKKGFSCTIYFSKHKQTSRQPNSLTARRTTSLLPFAREVSTDGPRASFLFLSFPLLLFTSILVNSDTSFLPFFLSLVPLSEWVIVALATPSLSLSFCDFFPGMDVTTRGSLREISGCIWLTDTLLSDSGSSDFMANKQVIRGIHIMQSQMERCNATRCISPKAEAYIF